MKHGGIVPDDFTLDTEQENKKLAKEMKPYIVDQMKRVKSQLSDMYGSSVIEWNVSSDDINSMMEERIKDIEYINGTSEAKVVDRVKDALSEGFENEDTVKELADRIKDAIGEGMEVVS